MRGKHLLEAIVTLINTECVDDLDKFNLYKKLPSYLRVAIDEINELSACNQNLLSLIKKQEEQILNFEKTLLVSEIDPSKSNIIEFLAENTGS